jgi:tetratricopeptide (TPR) repeat protein
VTELHLEARTVDLAGRRVRGGPREEALTETEAKLLAYLAAHPGRVIPRDELLAEVWGLKKAVVTRCVDTAVRRLRSKIEADPSEPRHLLKAHGSGYRFDPRGGPVAAAPVDPAAADLPADLGRFHGREAELARIGRLLADGARLVVVTGPPGSGRSRLVREAARRHGGRFAGGVRRSPAPGALVVLDGSDEIDAALGSGSAVLVAAAGPSGHPEENLVRIGPLDPSAAVALLRERTGAEHPADAELVVALDGLPLAIASAAARADVLAPPDLLGRADRFRRLGPTFEASVRRALDRLDPALRATLGQLAVFRGSFPLAWAEAVVGPDAVDALVTLVGRGLVEREPGLGSARFRVLAAVRTWLPEPDAALRARHLDAVLPWAEARKRDWHGSRPEQLADEVLAHLDDLEAAHATALEIDPVRAVRVLMFLDGPLLVRGPRDRHLRLHDAVRAKVAELPPLWQVRALTMRGEALRSAMRFADARVDLVEAARIAEGLEDPVELGHAVGYLATLDHTEHRLDRAEKGYREAAARLGAARHTDEAHYLGNLGQLLVHVARVAEAEPVLRRVLEIRCREGRPLQEAAARVELGWLLAEVGRNAEAEALLRAGIALAGEHGDPRTRAVGSNHLALVLLDEGRWDEVIEVTAAAIEAARPLGQLRTEAMALGFGGVARLFQGRLREAEALLRACVDVHRRTEQPWLGALATAWIGALEAAQGRVAESEATFASARAAVEGGAGDGDLIVRVLSATADVARARKRREGDARAVVRERLKAAEPALGAAAELRLAARYLEASLADRR